MKITRPTLLIDYKKCAGNIALMAEKAREHHLIFRPHFKTHQSEEIGKLFRNFGVDKITVSSVQMAKFFARKGWNDITIAFPVNILEIDDINQLASSIRLHLLVESVDAICFLSQNLRRQVGIFIKVDVGYHRTGIDVSNLLSLRNVIQSINANSPLKLEGFLTHAGHTYHQHNVESVKAVHQDAIHKLLELKQQFLPEHPGIIISYGDTPSCSICDDFDGIDEIRPGNFLFYDCQQLKIGSCTPDDLALAVACPIVALHPERNQAIIYGGAVHLSKDSFMDDSKVKFGYLAIPSNKGWNILPANNYVTALSQEHGILQLDSLVLVNLKIGDIVYVLPAHSCLAMDLLRKFKFI